MIRNEGLADLEDHEGPPGGRDSAWQPGPGTLEYTGKYGMLIGEVSLKEKLAIFLDVIGLLLSLKGTQ